MENKKVVSYATVFLSFVVLGYIIIVHTLNFLFPDLPLFTNWVIKTPELRFLLSFLFGVAILAIFWKKKSWRGFFSLPQSRKEGFLYLMSAFALAYFYRGSFSLFGLFPHLSLLVLTIFFFFFLPSLVEFYLRYDPIIFIVHFHCRINEYQRKHHLPTNLVGYWQAFFLFLERFKKAIGLFLVTIVAFVFIIGTGFGYISMVRKIRSSFYIESVTPAKNIYGEKVVIAGYNFGWKDSDRYRLMTNQGKVVTHLWTGNKIVFIVPLHLKQNKTVKLWLVRPERGKLIKSNPINFFVLDRMKFYPVLQDSLGVRAWKKIKRLLLLDNKYLNRLL